MAIVKPEPQEMAAKQNIVKRLTRENVIKTVKARRSLAGANLSGAQIDIDKIDLSTVIGWREAQWDEAVFERLLERFGEQEGK